MAKIEQDGEEVRWINPNFDLMQFIHYNLQWAIDAKLCVKRYARSSAIGAKLCVKIASKEARLMS